MQSNVDRDGITPSVWTQGAEIIKGGDLPYMMFWISFLFVMATSWKHVMWTFQQFEFAGDEFVAGLSATSVEVGYACVAYAIHQKRSKNEDTRWFWAFAIFLTVVSIFSNFIHNLSVSYGADVVFTPAIKFGGSLLLATAFPITSLVMADIVSSGSLGKGADSEAIALGKVTMVAMDYIKGKYNSLKEAGKVAGVSEAKMSRRVTALRD